MCETLTIAYTCGHDEDVSWFHCPRGQNYMGRLMCAPECRQPPQILRLRVHRRFCARCRRRNDEGTCDGFPVPEEDVVAERSEEVVGVPAEE